MVKKKYWLMLLVILVMLVTVTFEAAQQQFYIKRFSLNGSTDFFDLFINHLNRWLVWLFFAYFLLRYCKQVALNHKLHAISVMKMGVLIFALVTASVLVISIVQYIRVDVVLSLSNFWHEWFLFYTFQKAPIYTLAYVSFAAISYYYFLGRSFEIDLLKVSELNQEQQLRYETLKQRLQSADQLLNVKVGQKQHMIPVTDISWLEADNYCVNIYTNHITPYALRTSLKALESKLPDYFVRVHRKAIVNMKQVSAFNHNGSNSLELTDGTQVAVALSKVSMVRARLESMSCGR